MVRTFAVAACLVLCGAVGAGDIRPVRCAADRAEHKSERTRNTDESLARLRAVLAEIIERQQGLIANAHPGHHGNGRYAPQREPLLGEVATVVIPKGGYETVPHTISWRQYEDDDLTVTVSASDASLVVPERLDLNFEKHQFRFQYEIRAGDKTGAFTVTLTPTVGKPVTVQVIVK